MKRFQKPKPCTHSPEPRAPTTGSSSPGHPGGPRLSGERGLPIPSAPRRRRPFLQASGRLGPAALSFGSQAGQSTARTWRRETGDGSRARKRAKGLGRFLRLSQVQGRPATARRPRWGRTGPPVPPPGGDTYTTTRRPLAGSGGLGAAGAWLRHLSRPGAHRRPHGAERAGFSGRREGAARRVLGAARPASALARVGGARPSPTSPGRTHLSPMSSSSAAITADAAQARSAAS